MVMSKMRHEHEPAPQTPKYEPREAKLCAHPVAKLRDRKTQRLVGFLYKWNTGEHMPAWLDKPCPNALQEPLVEKR